MTATMTAATFAAACNGGELKRALLLVKPAVSRRGALPVLSGVKFKTVEGALEVTATDLDLTITARVAATIGGEGEVIVPHGMIAGLLKAKTGSLSFSVDGDEFVLSGALTCRIRTLPLDEWPRLEEWDGEAEFFDLSGLPPVVSAASSDESLPIISGVLFKGRDIVATDRYRLYLRRSDVDVPNVLVPARALKAIGQTKQPGAAIRVGERHVQIVTPLATYVSRLIEGEFPPYERLIPAEYPHVLSFSAAEALAAIAAVKPFVKDAITTPVRVEVGDGALKFIVITQEIGKGEAAIAVNSDASAQMTFGFNVGFLVDAISTGGDERVSMHYADPMKPASFTADGEDIATAPLLRLVMPVRLAN